MNSKQYLQYDVERNDPFELDVRYFGRLTWLEDGAIAGKYSPPFGSETQAWEWIANELTTLTNEPGN